MKRWILLLLCAPLLANAEQLPDSASTEDDSEDSMSERFDAPLMDSGEMESLYLESPMQLENAEESGGMESLSDENRYKESDLLFRERQNSDRLNPAPPAPRNEPLDKMPIAPMREL